MKYLTVISALLPILFSGCVRDDLSGCPPRPNVVLAFRYPEASGGDTFGQRVGSVEVMVYDMQGAFVRQLSLDRADLERFRGAEFDLDPGTYRIVCWGNAGRNSVMNESARQDLDRATITHRSCAEGVAADGDPLCYAPAMDDITDPDADRCVITVPAVGSVSRTVDFTAAHNTIEVYIEGVSSMPEVRIAELPQGYDFRMRALDPTMDYKQAAAPVTVSGVQMAGARFSVPQFDDDNDITIHITTPDSSWPISLERFLADNGIDVSPVRHDLIRIRVEYRAGSVNVTVPDWSGTGVEPVFGI